MKPVKRYFEIPSYAGPGVYMIRNLDNGRCYIGSTVNINYRLKTHNYSFNGLWCNMKIRPDIIAGCHFRSEILEKLPFDVDENTLRACEQKHFENTPSDLLYNFPSHMTPMPSKVTNGRVVLFLPKGKKELVQTHAEAQGQSVNGYINSAIDEKMARDSKGGEHNGD